MPPSPGRFSLGVAGAAELPPIPKLPNVPMGDMLALAGAAPHGEAGPLPSALPAVLLRIKLPKGELFFVAEDGSSSFPLSLRSVLVRRKNGDASSLLKRVAEGDASAPNGESVVSRRRVLGREVEGDASPKLPTPPELCDIEPFLPFALTPGVL